MSCRFVGYWQYSSLSVFPNQLHNILKKHAFHALSKIGKNRMTMKKDNCQNILKKHAVFALSKIGETPMTMKKDDYNNILKKLSHLFMPVLIFLRIITR